MNRTMLWGGALLVAAAVVAGTIWSNQAAQAPKEENASAVPEVSSGKSVVERPARPFPDSTAPDFVLRDLEGQQVQLSSLRGEKLFVNFWASWCPPCQAEMPHLVNAARKYEGQVAFYGVNLTSGDSVEKAKIPFPTLLDEKGEVASRYAAFSIPTSLTIDENGVIVDRIEGPLTEAGMEDKIRALMKDSAK